MAKTQRFRLSSSTSEDDDSDCKGKRQKRFYEEKSSFNSPDSSYATTKPESVGGIGEKLMARMGFKIGSGLGKHGQGIVAPVAMSTQRGRRGLGLHLEGLEPADIKWDSSQEVVEVRETVKWLEEDTHIPINLAQLKTWMVEGPPKKVLDGETEFCDPDVLRNVLNSKSVFDRLDKNELMKSRSRSNPFETIGKGIFLNRAAMKMANMDASFDFMFTNPMSISDPPHSLVGPNELLYFADVCAGPGGFSEYVLWRCGWEAKGFGMTLRDSNDFKLEEFHAGPCESFEPYYGVHEDGNVYDPANIDSFQQYVMDHTFQRGVHFMMADGGFSVDGQENVQEILSKQLYLCQCLVALKVVRTHGHFVVKLFDLFTPFSVGLVYLMYKAFYRISVFKPNSSRPANSERYLVCKWKREDTSSIRDYLFEVNLKLNRKHSKNDVLELVPVHILKEDIQFYDFIYDSNNVLGERQIVNLVKIKAYCQDVNLLEDRQAEMKRACLEFWKVPDGARRAPRIPSPEDKMRELLNVCKPSWLNLPARQLTKEYLEKEITPYDWRCMVLECCQDRPSPLTFYLGMGRSHVYSWDRDRGQWYKCHNLELSPNTLIYAELATELKGENRKQYKLKYLHIIDALFLGGTDVRSKHLKERLELCQKYALAVNKPSRSKLTQIRVKELFSIADLRPLYARLVERSIKSYGGQLRLGFTLSEEEERFIFPGGILFLKTTLEPWVMALSRSSNKKYWYNKVTRQSVYECPHNANMDFVKCFECRLWWAWTPDVNLSADPNAHGLEHNSNSHIVHRNDLDSFLYSQMKR